MRPFAIIFGVLLLAIGAVWTGQGLGYIKGSFMTGSHFWLAVGLVCLAAGAALIGSVLMLRRKST